MWIIAKKNCNKSICKVCKVGLFTDASTVFTVRTDNSETVLYRLVNFYTMTKLTNRLTAVLPGAPARPTSPVSPRDPLNPTDPCRPSNPGLP